MISIQPLTPERWMDFEQLFGPHGACGGCWCMYWRQSTREFEQQHGEQNRQAMQNLVNAGSIPGLLAYDHRVPAGWCSIAPREEFPRLARSRILKPVDDQPVWSVVCFFMARSQRRKGLSIKLLKAAVEFAASQAAKIVEGYPLDLGGRPSPDAFAYPGLRAAFIQAGFHEVVRRSPTRPIMRIDLQHGEMEHKYDHG
jgi:GNAT superfamily N-acetyltransferase